MKSPSTKKKRYEHAKEEPVKGNHAPCMAVRQEERFHDGRGMQQGKSVHFTATTKGRRSCDTKKARGEALRK